MEKKVIVDRIKKETTSVLWQIMLFGACYLSLTVLFLAVFAGLLFGCGFLVYFPFYMFPGTANPSNPAELGGFIVYAAVIIAVFVPFLWCSFQILRHFIQSLFLTDCADMKDRLEITRNDCPELYDMIGEIARKTGNKIPEHIYLSPEVGASVMYKYGSKRTFFLHVRKSLMVGLGLLQGLNKDELRSIIAHEFGHFSQQTKNVGLYVYRISLIVHHMMILAQTQERLKLVAKSKHPQGEHVITWHMASWPISFLTRKFAGFYRDIEKRSSLVSRLMEYEADAVACQIVGAKPFVSSLYKMTTLQEWYQTYENLVSCLLAEKQSLRAYWSGYDYIYGILSEDAQLPLSFNDILTAGIGDDARYPSKVMMLDGWDTHPSLEERIESIMELKLADNAIDMTDARSMVPAEIMETVGRLRQQVMAQKLQEPIVWTDVREINLDDFKAWADENIKMTLVPNFLVPFIFREVVSFSIPLPEEELQEAIETPFTAENRELVLEFRRGMEDYRMLAELSQKDSGIKNVMYEGKVCDCKLAFEEQSTYLDSFGNRMRGLDIDIYKYLWHRAKDKSQLNNEYWALFYGNDSLQDMSGIMDDVNAVRQPETSANANDKEISIGDYVLTQITREFWKFMRSFNYKAVNVVCHDWESKDGATLEQLLNKWYAFASTDIPPYVNAADLFYMIDRVHALLNALYNYGKQNITCRIIRAYNNMEEPEPYRKPEK